MPALKLFTDVQARVVAWHNRHPLARRIQASQVHSIGEVALPFAAPAGAAATTPAAAAALPPAADLLAEPTPDLHGLASTEDVPSADPAPPPAAQAAGDLATHEPEAAPWPDDPASSTVADSAAGDGAATDAAPTALGADIDADADAGADAEADTTGSAEAEAGPEAPEPEHLTPPDPAPPGSDNANANAKAQAEVDTALDDLLQAVADPNGAPPAADAAPPALPEATAAEANTDSSDDDLPEFVVNALDAPTAEPATGAHTDTTAEAPAPAEAEAGQAPEPEVKAEADADADADAAAVADADAEAGNNTPAPAEPEPGPSEPPLSAEDTANEPPPPQARHGEFEATAADLPATGELQPTGVDLNAHADDALLLQTEAALDAQPADPPPPSLADRLHAARQAALGHGEGAEAALAATDAAAAAAPAQPDPADAPAPGHDAAAATATATAALPSFARPPQPWWRRWLARWRSRSGRAKAAAAPVHANLTGSTAAPPGAAQPLGPLTALFSGKFLWPVSPARVARWARRHGSRLPLAPPDWPLRRVSPEPALQQKARQAGRPETTTVHLFTAAIGVDDRRMRVLVSADGQVLGPRAYDRPRVAAASLALVLALGGLGWRLKPAAVPGLPPAEEAAELALADEAASAPASAEPEPPPAHPADQAHSTEQAEASAHAAASAPAAGQPPTEPVPPEAPAQTYALDDRGATAAVDGSDPPPRGLQSHTAASAPAPAPSVQPTGGFVITSTPPPAFPQRRASGPVAQIRPQLPEDVRLAARAQSEAARNAASKNQPMPVALPTQRYAVVSLPERDRETAEARLATMLSVRAQLPPPAPLHSDVMPTQGRWRVALWPFANQADAERARTMLQVRGLSADVVEF